MDTTEHDLGPMAEEEPRFRVLVVELDAFLPRRRPDRPNLYVGITAQDRTARFKQLQRGRGPVWTHGHVVKMRADLTRTYRPGNAANAKRQKSKIIAKLKRRAYTVNRDMTVWRLYVIDLDDSAAADPGRGWVYVGQTTKNPDVRLAEHLGGARNERGPLYSRVVYRHGLGLRRDLMERIPVLYSQEAAIAAEADLAKWLRDQGFRVEGGH